METQETIKSVNTAGSAKKVKLAIGIVGGMLLALVIFSGGVAVGLHKAKFSYQWGQNYERNFMGAGFSHGDMPNRGPVRGGEGMTDFFRDVEGRDFRNAHGLAGTIISVADNNLLVKDRDNKENTVAITDKTIIKDHMLDVKITDLKVNDQIVVMGRPDEQGVISADLIRIFCCSKAEELNNSN